MRQLHTGYAGVETNSRTLVSSPLTDLRNCVMPMLAQVVVYCAAHADAERDPASDTLAADLAAVGGTYNDLGYACLALTRAFWCAIDDPDLKLHDELVKQQFFDVPVGVRNLLLAMFAQMVLGSTVWACRDASIAGEDTDFRVAVDRLLAAGEKAAESMREVGKIP